MWIYIYRIWTPAITLQLPGSHLASRPHRVYLPPVDLACPDLGGKVELLVEHLAHLPRPGLMRSQRAQAVGL